MSNIYKYILFQKKVKKKKEEKLNYEIKKKKNFNHSLVNF
jgi:hypothetical protein